MNIGPISQAVIALLSFAAHMADVEPEPIRLVALALDADCADDTFFAHNGVWLLTFGAYSTHRVVACGHLEDALEDAATVLPQGMFVEPDYETAARELGHAWPPHEADYDVWDDIRDRAETDLTYTESGWLVSHEWTCDAVEAQS